jgi:hypothetical protein
MHRQIEKVFENKSLDERKITYMNFKFVTFAHQNKQLALF